MINISLIRKTLLLTGSACLLSAAAAGVASWSAYCDGGMQGHIVALNLPSEAAAKKACSDHLSASGHKGPCQPDYNPM